LSTNQYQDICLKPQQPHKNKTKINYKIQFPINSS
jgi:hypothetical protein